MYEKAHLMFRNFASFYLFEHVLLFPLLPQISISTYYFLTLQSMLLITFK